MVYCSIHLNLPYFLSAMLCHFQCTRTAHLLADLSLGFYNFDGIMNPSNILRNSKIKLCVITNDL